MTQILSKKWIIACIITGGLVAIGLYATSQPRLSGAFGLSLSKKIVGNLNFGYEVGKVQFNSTLIHSLPSGITVHGPSVGVKIKERLIPFVGYSRVEFGRKSSLDRYVKDGDTTNLQTLKSNTWSVPFGVSYIRERLFINSGYVTGKYRLFFVTVGITHLFD